MCFLATITCLKWSPYWFYSTIILTCNTTYISACVQLSWIMNASVLSWVSHFKKSICNLQLCSQLFSCDMHKNAQNLCFLHNMYRQMMAYNCYPFFAAMNSVEKMNRTLVENSSVTPIYKLENELHFN